MVPVRRSQNWLPEIFNDFFDNDWVVRTNATAPAINVLENEHSYELEVAAPGMNKNDFKVHIDENGNLSIEMEKKVEDKEEKKHGHYLYLADLIPLHAHKNLATTVQLLWEDEDANDTKKVALLSLSQLGLSSDPDALKNLPLLQELQQKGVPIFLELPKDFTLNPAETEKLSGLSYFSIASRVSTLLT